MMWDEKRFVCLNEFLLVEVAAVYVKNAAALKASVAWGVHPTDMKWEAPARITPSGRELKETAKLYLKSRSYAWHAPDVDARGFSTPMLDPLLDPKLTEDFIEIRIARKEGVRAVCAPRSLDEEYREAVGMNPEEFEAAGKKFWGFGLEHPYKDAFEPHKRIAGPLVDYWGFVALERQWKFKPVFVKILDGEVSHYFRIWTDLWKREVGVTELLLEDAPAELVAYDLAGTRPKTVWHGEKKVAAPDSPEASAAVRRFVKK